ncbi:MAG: glycosyltransferase family 4 protein [Flavobacteriales bacterium]|jgi:glycosyltransferase involved in cell wall biosynthesis|nr:glycosyltransferase family 4 protein [Flavobacteriales bacterium]
MKKIKVAISQRIIPHYRVPVFTEFSARQDISLTVFYGKSFKSGSQVNADSIINFNAKKLFTIMLNYKGAYGSSQLRVWHPFLIFHLIVGNYDVVIVEPSTNFYNNIFSFIYCKIFRKKFIWHESGSVPKKERPLFRRMIDPFLSIFIKGSNAFVTYNSYADKSLKRDFNIDSKKIFRAQNTIDTSNIDKEIKIFLPEVNSKKKELELLGFKVALYIGGIEKRKKIENLIKAITHINNSGIPSKALIVGDGPDKDDLLNSLTAEDKLNTIFAGKHIKEATLYVLLSDVVVLPSSGGLSVMTAFACKKPFVGSEEIEHGGIKDYVEDGINGFLVKENDIEDLESKLRKVFTDSNLYNELCKNSYNTSKQITIANMVDGFENAIKHTIK